MGRRGRDLHEVEGGGVGSHEVGEGVGAVVWEGEEGGRDPCGLVVQIEVEGRRARVKVPVKRMV
jgi:hypothetical protein